ncbi:MAG: Xaa-Pro peptidase family protein [Candidatus Bathyarchaeia archaeon]
MERLIQTMDAEGLDCFLLSTTNDILYFIGFSGALKALVSRTGEVIVYVSSVNFEEAKRKVRVGKVELTKFEGLFGMVAEKIREDNLRRVAFKGLDAEDYMKLREIIERVSLEPKGELIWKLRRVKDNYEIKMIREAAKITSMGMEKAIDFIKPGIREYEVAAEAEYVMRRNGADGMAFETIVASGERTSLPHGGCTRRRIKRSEIVMVDLGAKYGGYCVDMTRTIVVGTPNQRQRDLFYAVKSAQEQAMKTLKDGVEAYKPDEEARKTLKMSKLEEHFVHSLGHGLGLEVHEPPALKAGNVETLEKGNVVTIEPGVYIPGFGGIRIEDTVHILEDGFEKLTSFPVDITA